MCQNINNFLGAVVPTFWVTVQTGRMFVFFLSSVGKMSLSLLSCFPPARLFQVSVSKNQSLNSVCSRLSLRKLKMSKSSPYRAFLFRLPPDSPLVSSLEKLWIYTSFKNISNFDECSWWLGKSSKTSTAKFLWAAQTKKGTAYKLMKRHASSWNFM